MGPPHCMLLTAHSECACATPLLLLSKAIPCTPNHNCMRHSHARALCTPSLTPQQFLHPRPPARFVRPPSRLLGGRPASGRWAGCAVRAGLLTLADGLGAAADGRRQPPCQRGAAYRGPGAARGTLEAATEFVPRGKSGAAGGRRGVGVGVRPRSGRRPRGMSRALGRRRWGWGGWGGRKTKRAGRGGRGRRSRPHCHPLPLEHAPSCRPAPFPPRSRPLPSGLPPRLLRASPPTNPLNPQGRTPYLQWREELKRRHAATVVGLMAAQGYPPEAAQRVEALIMKRMLKEPEGQAIEDALCLGGAGRGGGLRGD